MAVLENIYTFGYQIEPSICHSSYQRDLCWPAQWPGENGWRWPWDHHESHSGSLHLVWYEQRHGHSNLISLWRRQHGTVWCVLEQSEGYRNSYFYTSCTCSVQCWTLPPLGQARPLDSAVCKYVLTTNDPSPICDKPVRHARKVSCLHAIPHCGGSFIGNRDRPTRSTLLLFRRGKRVRSSRPELLIHHIILCTVPFLTRVLLLQEGNRVSCLDAQCSDIQRLG